MNEAGIRGLQNASPEKRFQSFLTTAADREEVYLLTYDGEWAAMELGERDGVPIWPEAVFAKDFCDDEVKATPMEVHAFLDRCRELEEGIAFFVFPTDKDTYVIDKDSLRAKLQEALDEVE